MSAGKRYTSYRPTVSGDLVMACIVYQLGLIDYGEAYHHQRQLIRQRLDGEIEDTLLLLEHPPTITIGKSGKPENVLVSQEQLTKQGISLFFTDRGGDVTYHGPGQLVAYPIIDLRNRGRDIHRYIRELEEVVIRTLADFSISAHRDSNHAGVWVKEAEIAAIGLSVKRWITMHGIALNINSNLEHFTLINPCGFTDRTATSISRLLGWEIAMAEVTQRLVAHFSDVFNVNVEWGSGTLTGSRP
jgi:lipoate-protein ligase B